MAPANARSSIYWRLNWKHGAWPSFESVSRATNSSFGKLVARYLNGGFGSLATVDPHLSALLYAGDRLESKAGARIGSRRRENCFGRSLHWFESGASDRRASLLNSAKSFWNGSNVSNMDFTACLQKTWCCFCGFPPEAHRLVGMKAERSYTPLQRDIQEEDIAHLEQTAVSTNSWQPNTTGLASTVPTALGFCVRLRRSAGWSWASWNLAFYSGQRLGIRLRGTSWVFLNTSGTSGT